MTGPDADTRVALLEATVAVVADVGMNGLAVTDVAARAGVGRATVYRYFPDGRDQLIGEAITWEVSHFLSDLADLLAPAKDLGDRLDTALLAAHRRLQDHDAFQRVLAEDRSRFLARLHEIGPMLIDLVAGYLRPYLEDEPLQDGLSAAAAADYLARLMLSFIADGGVWDLSDDDQRRQLIDTHFVTAVLE